jgi:hypothetical protein
MRARTPVYCYCSRPPRIVASQPRPFGRQIGSRGRALLEKSELHAWQVAVSFLQKLTTAPGVAFQPAERVRAGQAACGPYRHLAAGHRVHANRSVDARPSLLLDQMDNRSASGMACCKGDALGLERPGGAGSGAC